MWKKIYRKEMILTAAFAAVLMICGHSEQIFVLFPSLQVGSIWGFPPHYVIPILVGWLGLLLVTVLMAVVLNKFDDEMEEYSLSVERQRSKDS